MQRTIQALLNLLRPILPKMPTSTEPPFEELREGAAKALYQKGAVFYNPAQVVNRDLSILILRHFQREHAIPSPKHPNPVPLRILEALSATGLRAVRYFREIPHVATVTANDLDENAVQTIRRNVLHNALSPDKHVLPSHANAIHLMARSTSRDAQFHVVDLDPYGSAAPFLDAAVQAVTDRGILAVTCTDLAVLCGNSPEICFARYASTPLKGPTAHEMAVRTVFGAVQAAANRHSRAVEPLLCAKIDFYVRLFFRVRDSKLLAQQTPAHMSLVFQCVECATQRLQCMGRVRANPVSNAARKKRRRMREEDEGKPAGKGGAKDVKLDATVSEGAEEVKIDVKNAPQNVKYTPPLVTDGVTSHCSICGGAMMMGGPIWNGPLIGEGVAESVMGEIESGVGEFKARDRVGAIVRLVEEEVKSVPLFMHLPGMCKVLRVCPPPAASVRSVLAKKGYKVSQSHTDPQAIKTTAPPELVWDILKLWVEKDGNSPLLKQMKGENAENIGGDTKGKRPPAGVRILRKKAEMVKMEEVDFSVKKDKFVRRGNVESQGVRFPQNPEPYWGPKARAGKRKNDQLEAQQEDEPNEKMKNS